ncbi:unnamed protein product (macronuclear) [Paramecium tetraurelia]|uniref:Uncharacterized protein n=1 Tax=Paramecium tetraurelia TaxID=5888 RepID=A0EG37_PARTE|nr:uncharacterized protein GSPATT00026601001 [Paramecium tetraurelia]CAK94278.1 unnamed protein product [Paramecium tetraurelia]|eukprot:XP_001461651.1 hypothetical protein (macronuclear) [Paramecium tetraurelia strain d4-2]
MDNEQEVAIKLGIVGNQGAGKTSLILRVAEKKFCGNQNCGVAVDFRSIRDYKLNGKRVNLNIFDIAGLARNSDLALSFIKDASALVLAFSLPEQEYYENQEGQLSEQLEVQIQNWTDKIYDNSSENTPVFIVGCKLDLVKDQKRLIPALDENLQEILKKCKKVNIINNSDKNMIFFPTSALSGNGVDKLFQKWSSEASKIKKSHGSTLKTKSHLKKENQKEQCC